ncbi:hypothetical protein SDC9_123083 [bioreactor metagenome]|uniref:Uncharacterized protein n=1 Tax=bioreactor metagenome TaxID=1076179 RepID=A0A645CGT3_9ZZZZ
MAFVRFVGGLCARLPFEHSSNQQRTTEPGNRSAPVDQVGSGIPVNTEDEEEVVGNQQEVKRQPDEAIDAFCEQNQRNQAQDAIDQGPYDRHVPPKEAARGPMPVPAGTEVGR